MADEKRSLGRELHEIRTLKKLSQRDVEQATGISNAYLSQLENDKVSKPSPHFLHKLAKLYSVDYEMLMEAAGYVQDRQKGSGQSTLLGAALCSDKDLTQEEAQQLATFLKFLREQKK